MTQTLLKTAMSANEDKEVFYKCDWSNCEGKHTKKINYPNNGKFKKSGYREKWIAAGMQPWDLYGENKKRLRENGKDYRTKTYEYKTQGHHLVPTTLLEKTSTLKNNIVLIDYNCDDEENGMMLPEFQMDIPLHNLQAHLGNHPDAYMGPIREKLRQYENDYDGICKDDLSCNMTIQSGLKSVIETLSGTARKKILNIKTGKKFWPVRSNAFNEYNDAQIEYQKRLTLHLKL